MAEGKKEFYAKAKEAFTARGYRFYDGDKDIVGKGLSHASKPDYIATKGRIIVVGEIKSPAESPTSSSWRQPQNSDGEAFKRVRLEVAQKEISGKLPKEIGGHEIIIRGQIQDYFEKRGRTYIFPSSVSESGSIIAGYTFPAKEKHNVEQALLNCDIDNYEKIDTGNGSVTFIFDYQNTNSSTLNEIDTQAPLLAYYCILKKYKGLFKNKFDLNTHLFFFPVSDEKYIYLAIQGQVLDEEDSYVCKLMVEMENHLLQPLINGEKEEFGKQFLVVEALPCIITSTSGGYILHFYKKGRHIKSDLSLQYLEDGPSYIMRGILNLETEDRIL